MELREKTQLTPTLRLERKLGEGGMGSVWVAYNEVLDNDVAVKLIANTEALTDSQISRFKREAKAAAKIRSPHVVSVFDCNVTEHNVPFIVMELLDGESLAQRLARGGRMDAEELVTLLEQVAGVLDMVHARGIVHRDIKPANLFLVEGTRGLFVKVLDFGIAKYHALSEVSDLTATGTLAGTPRYMSPEQLLSSKDVDGRCDLWSLSVVAYRALTGRHPFEANTLPELTLKVFRGEFALPSEHIPDLEESFDAWFERAFDIDVERRFQTPNALVSTFRLAMDGAYPSSETDTPWTRRSKVNPLDDPPSGSESTLPAGSRALTLTVDEAVASTVLTDGESSEPSAAVGADTLESATSRATVPIRSRSWPLAVVVVVGALVLVWGAMTTSPPIDDPRPATTATPPTAELPATAGVPASPTSAPAHSFTPPAETARPAPSAAHPPAPTAKPIARARAAPAALLSARREPATPAEPQPSGTVAAATPPSATAAVKKDDCNPAFFLDGENNWVPKPDCLNR